MIKALLCQTAHDCTVSRCDLQSKAPKSCYFWNLEAQNENSQVQTPVAREIYA